MNTERPQNRRQKGRQNMTAQAATVTRTPGAIHGGDLLTLDELAHKLRMHPDTVRGLKRRGVIPAIVIGHRTLRFSWPDVLDTLRRKGDPAADQAE